LAVELAQHAVKGMGRGLGQFSFEKKSQAGGPRCRSADPRDVAGWSRTLPPADARRLPQDALGQHPRPVQGEVRGALASTSILVVPPAGLPEQHFGS